MSISTKTAQKKVPSDKSIFRKQENSKSSLNKQNSSAQDILTLHKTIGNQAVQRLFESGFIQGKLTIGEPNDKYEQEADRVADAVMRMPEPQVQRQNEEDEEEEMIQTKPVGDQITPLVQRQVEEEEEETLQAKAKGQTPLVTPNVESKINALQGGGKSLSKETRNFFEPRLGQDFSQVRIHIDSNANQLARSVNARAFTRGNNIVFGGGEYSPGSSSGKRLLGHELTHVVQQGSASKNNHMQRTDVRSPAFEEAVTQISTMEASIHGQPLTDREIDLARPIFQDSIDYDRVRLIPTRLLEWRTVGNTIRVPVNFSISNAYMARVFIHEMTHVWQYQHGGTSYISTSLADQIVGAIETGSRDAAYAYQIVPGKSFLEYRVEQQAFMVERYFAFLREQADTDITSYHRSQVESEISLHQPLIDQMRAALPRREVDILIMRAVEVIQHPGLLGEELLPRERRPIPLKPLFEVRF